MRDRSVLMSQRLKQTQKQVRHRSVLMSLRAGADLGTGKTWVCVDVSETEADSETGKTRVCSSKERELLYAVAICMHMLA